MKKLFAVLFIIFGASAGLGWLYFFEQYSAASPDVPVATQGKLIEQNNHGHVFFIDKEQDDILWHLALATFIALPIGGLLFRKK